MTSKSNGKRLISLKIMAERSKQYIAWVQFIMIGVIFIQSTNFNLPMTLLLVVLFLGILSVIDFKWILPAELNRISEKNPVLMSMKKDLAEIKKNLKESDVNG